MNKYPIVALVLLLAGIALLLNSAGISCPFSGDNSSCQSKESGSINCGANCGNCAGNCSGNCTGNGICPNEPACAQNNSNSTEENCAALGSCPVKTGH